MSDTLQTVSAPPPDRPRYPGLRPPWKKGESGNPGGVHKELLELRKLALSNAPRAIEVTKEAMESDNEIVRLKAAEMMCKWAGLQTELGKVASEQTVDVGGLSQGELQAAARAYVMQLMMAGKK